MAHLTFDPATEELSELLFCRQYAIVQALEALERLGVAKDDIVVKIQECHTTFCPAPHLEIILKTDNPRVTAPVIVHMLARALDGILFEVSRVPVGYGVIEAMHEIWAFITRTRRNWASNYPSYDTDL